MEKNSNLLTVTLLLFLMVGHDPWDSWNDRICFRELERNDKENNSKMEELQKDIDDKARRLFDLEVTCLYFSTLSIDALSCSGKIFISLDITT